MKRIMIFYAGLFLFLMLSLPFKIIASPEFSCGTTISSFPYNESFESSLGAWSNGGPNNLWSRGSGLTPSSNTGPSSGDNGSTYYVFTEASGSGNPFKVHSLEGPCFDLTGIPTADFSFSYHMYGTYMGELTFQVSTDGGSNWTTLWTKTGDQGNQWFQETLTLNAYVGQTINTRFYGYTGDSWSSDMAIDEIALTLSTPPTGLTCANTISSFPYAESFESGTGAWIEETTTNVWRQNAGATGSLNTGPSSAADGSQYMYTESSVPNSPSVSEYFTGPCFDLSTTNDAYFAFQYHMLGATIGSLELEIQTDANPSWTSIWNRSGPFGDIWTTAFIDLSAYTGQNIQLRFQTTTGSSYTGDIAIDDLRLETTAAPVFAGCSNTIHQFPYFESFESDFGDWVETGSPSLWSRVNSFFSPDGNYFIRALGGPVISTGGSSALESPCLDLSTASDAYCTFHYLDYWITAGATGSISLQVSDDGGANWTSIWYRGGNNTNSLWQATEVDLSNYLGATIQLRFLAEFGPNSAIGVQIDNFQLYAPTSPPVGNVTGQITFAQTTGCADPIYQYCCEPQSIGGLAMPNVGVRLITGSNTVATLSDGTGTFSGNVASGDLSLETTINNNDWSNGISITDVIAVNKHAIDNQFIQCPLQRLAADVDGDGDIDANDANLIQQMSLGSISTFPGGENWKFIPKGLVQPSDLHPDERFYADFWNSAKADMDGDAYPFKAALRKMDGTNTTYTSTKPWYNHFNNYVIPNCDGVDLGFYGVKVGDVNSSATHNTFGSPYNTTAATSSSRGLNPNLARQQRIDLERNEAELRSRKYKYEVKIVASIDEPILGYQFSVNFDDEIVTLDRVKPNKEQLEQSIEKNYGQAKKTLRGGSFATQWVTDFKRAPLGKGINNIVLLNYEFKSDLPLAYVERAFSLEGAEQGIQFYGKEGLIEHVDLQVFVERSK